MRASCFGFFVECNDSLVARPSKRQRHRCQLLHKRPIDKDICFAKQGLPIGVIASEDVFVKIARVSRDSYIPFMARMGDFRKIGRLQKRLAAAEGDAVKQRVLSDLIENFVDSDFITTARVVRMRVVTTGTTMRTALRENCESHAGAVRDRLRHEACNANHWSFVWHGATQNNDS